MLMQLYSLQDLGPKTGKDKTIMVDLDGAVKTIEATKKAGVKRFVMVSSFDTTRKAIQEAPEIIRSRTLRRNIMR